MKPDYAFWDQQPEYVTHDAAFLCCDRNPPQGIDFKDADYRKLEVIAARLKREVPCRDVGKSVYFQRSDLRDWAESTGQRSAMPFLFPEDRAESAGAIGVVRGLPQLGGAMPSLEASHKSVVVTVTGREAIPARALPFVTAWTLSPDAVAAELAQRKEARKLAKRLRAYHLSDNGDLVEMQPKEWDMVVKNLKALSARLDAAGMSREESYAFWRRDSILCLPSGVFLWRDEFDGAFFGGDVWTIMDERPGDRGWSAVPMIPNELHKAVMEGFQAERPSDQLDPAFGAFLSDDESPITTPSKRRATRTEDTLYRVIGALAQALAEAQHSPRVPLMADGKAFAGGGVKGTGVAGYLLEQGLTSLKPTALQDHIGTALRNYERPQPRPAQSDPEIGR
ncbi:hypothetical protein [uncultured Thiodictyon sp.]|uniref:hypothetical protein n=1 Tax=uncultured Thiodictyon sp. TaxID=1846217 RepID=UPI0025F6F9F2|nr:hypothetical protein [uncultured Thiodictyon sp.]